jgi:phage-related protein
LKVAVKDFGRFPEAVQEEVITALRMAARGEKADSAKPMKGLGAGVFEIAQRYRTDAYRTVYAIQLDEDIWVIHAFEKKSKTGIKPPKPDVDLVRERIKRLKEQLR